MFIRATVYTKNGRYCNVVLPTKPGRFKKAWVVKGEAPFDDDFNKLSSKSKDFHLLNDLVRWWNQALLSERQAYVAAVNNVYDVGFFKEVGECKIELFEVKRSKKSKKQALRDVGLAMLVRFLEGCNGVEIPNFLIEHFNAESYGNQLLSSGKVFFSPCYDRYYYVNE